ncbi:MAG: winged helix-turn-helix transcriptional regulator [Rubellimicrobium sp.]|nr:winged helix-turn-helix transcriptional regulator [Rubellimicrobium sp.]
MRRFGSASFDPDFMTFRRDDGLTLRLTRSERLLLRHLVDHPGRLLSRNQLLDAISEPGADKSDRTVDFIINRLRGKLNDDATSPRYIATRYGEGYVWVARETAPAPPPGGAWLVIGPVRRLGALDFAPAEAEAFVAALQEGFVTGLGAGRQVAVLPDYLPGDLAPADRPDFAVEVTFTARAADAVDVVVSVVQGSTGRIVHVERGAAGLPDSAARMAQHILTSIWKGHLLDPHQPQPMVVSLSKAGIALTGDPANWAENDARLRAMLKQDPDDPVLRLLHATHLDSLHVIAGPAFFLEPLDLDATRAEVEGIVTAVLPQIQHDPVHRMSAARLLFFLGPAFRPLALDLAEASHAEGTALAASYGTIGQLRACMGDIEAGVADYDIALGMTEPGSQYDLFLLVLKAQAQLAAGLRDDLPQTLATLYERQPELAPFMEVFCSPVGAPSPVARMALGATPIELATAMLRYLYHSCTDHFVQPGHRLNTIEAGARLYVGRFGAAVMPPELLPEFGHLAG